MTKNNAVPTLAWSLVAILAAACLLLAWHPWEASPPPEPAECDERFDQRIDKMLEPTHGEQDWSEVIAGWDELLTEKDLCERQVREIQRHHRNAIEGQKAAREAVKKFERPAGEIRGQPKEAPKEQAFLDYYPTGRRTQGVACFNVNGMGSNEGWFLRGDVFFAYQYEVLVETTVTKNTGKDAVFEVRFPHVKQIRAVSEEKVELRVPEVKSPIVRLVWRVADAALAYNSRTYRVVRALGRAIARLDPKLQKSLTTVNDVLSEKLGLPRLTEREDIELVEQVESLSGRHFRMTYVRDLGITNIEVLDGGPLTRDQLEKLAYNSSVLMDYYICPNAESRKPGDRWEVNAADVAGLVSMDVGTEITGTLGLKHGGQKEYKGDDCIDLQVVGGEVNATWEDDNGRQTTTIRPQDGSYVRFSTKLRMVRGARLEWQVNEMRVNENHLLFGTTHQHDVRVESFYEAELVDSSQS